MSYKKKDFYDSGTKRNLLQQEYTAKKLEKLEKSNLREKKQFELSFMSSIMGFILIVLISVYLLRIKSGSVPLPTFRSFLEMLTNVQVINVNTVIGALRITSDWGIFNGFRDFLNIGVILPLELVGFIVSNLINVVTYIIYFVQWIFAV